jgi:glycosyltransferase involved in cell wall biosynthesis
MTLRVGVVVGRISATEGGGWTITTALSRALKKAKSTHEFLFLDKFLEPEVSGRAESRVFGNISHQILRRGYRDGMRIARKIMPQNLWHRVAKPQGGDSYLYQLQAVFDQNELDVVWFMTPPGAPLSVPFITTVWDLEHRKQPYFPEITKWSWIYREESYRAVLPRASFVITGTGAGKKEIVHYYGVDPENVKVIQIPVPGEDLNKTSLDIQALREKYKIKGDFLFYPAQFWPHKNHINLLMALDILRKRNGLRFSLILTGSDKGNREYVLEKVRAWDLSEQVFDLGFVSREELTACYMNALALVFPSFFGPDNIPPLEAFSLRCPVVASRISGAEEQLLSCALLFDPASPTDMADKILSVSADTALRKKLIDDGAKIALSRTPERYIAQIEEILDGFAARRRCWGREYRPT